MLRKGKGQITRGKVLALAHKERTVKENSRLLTCVYNWLKSSEENSNSSRFGDLTPAIAAQRVLRTVRTVATWIAQFLTKVFKVLVLAPLKVNRNRLTVAMSSGWPLGP